ncbi:n-acetyltransferase domain-containing protein [Trichonephila inaurata madagascariensis]|uniref:N-acetyltransferase domain-containing protein n=1 Tax=Trichonephila inaurata madagascariensis TaxID=2747483 RepID=A0A8X7CTJ0_9ARAC|nr:n-acetyltransferase domain-containing protein [Trichonephila inaurata madagascariensis]GFY78486.1 n-acetyltransferase domain-containing protein [Trichonephila inaurata madagascariensis]
MNHFTTEAICNAARMLVNKSATCTRQMPRTITTIQQQDKDQILAEKEKFSFTIRNACEDDISTIMETRRSIGVHDVLTVVQTAIKLDPQAIKIAQSEEGSIIGTAAATYIGDDENGVHFAGLYFVSPKFRGRGVGVKVRLPPTLYF